MLIIWSGGGILVVPFLAVGPMLGGLGENVGDTWGHGQLGGSVATIVGFLLGGLLIRLVGNRLNKYDDQHRFFGMPMQHWAWLSHMLAVIGSAIMIARYLQG